MTFGIRSGEEKKDKEIKSLIKEKNEIQNHLKSLLANLILFGNSPKFERTKPRRIYESILLLEQTLGRLKKIVYLNPREKIWLSRAIVELHNNWAFVERYLDERKDRLDERKDRLAFGRIKKKELRRIRKCLDNAIKFVEFN